VDIAIPELRRVVDLIGGRFGWAKLEAADRVAARNYAPDHAGRQRGRLLRSACDRKDPLHSPIWPDPPGPTAFDRSGTIEPKCTLCRELRP